MNIGGSINGKTGEVRNVSKETAEELIGYMVAEEFISPPKPRGKRIIIHTRCPITKEGR